MKYLYRLILTAMLVTVSLTSCDDKTAVSDIPINDAEVYFSIDMSMPSINSGSRSSTTDEGFSTDGFQQATEAECAIKNMLLVFTDVNDNTLLFSLLGESSIKRDDSNKSLYKAVTSLKLSTVANTLAGKELNLYVLANPLPGPYNMLNSGNFILDKAIYNISVLDDIQLTTLGSLPMSNYERYKISGLTTSALYKHISDSDPLILNDYAEGSSNKQPLLLERCVARLDYKDGSKNSDNSYQIGESGYTVKLESLQLINISRAMYCMRHTSSDGSDSETILFGTEKEESGYIMDTDAALKRGNSVQPGHFINEGGKYYADKATPIDALTIDLDGKGYKFWNYITENTLPSIESQKQGLSTGIILHTRIINAPENVDLSGPDPITINYRGEEITVDYSAATSDNPAGYYIDYFYFIKHNDNNIDGLMGVMEYGIVRNNIYRLSLLSIDGLPRPYNPDGPDEDDRIELMVRVRKWGYHKIEFDM